MALPAFMVNVSAAEGSAAGGEDGSEIDLDHAAVRLDYPGQRLAHLQAPGRPDSFRVELTGW